MCPNTVESQNMGLMETQDNVFSTFKQTHAGNLFWLLHAGKTHIAIRQTAQVNCSKHGEKQNILNIFKFNKT